MKAASRAQKLFGNFPADSIATLEYDGAIDGLQFRDDFGEKLGLEALKLLSASLVHSAIAGEHSKTGSALRRGLAPPFSP
jgi:hypothetical protein